MENWYGQLHRRQNDPPTKSHPALYSGIIQIPEQEGETELYVVKNKA